MSSTPKKLVVELERHRETACQITGTRESLRLLAQDLSKALDEIPEQAAVSYLHLPGWEQHTFETYEDGFFFRVEPDLNVYIEQRRSSRSRILPWLHGAFGIILVALALIGLRAVWLWIF
jgi:hypothetical protein